MTEMRDLIADLPDQLRWAAEMSPPDMPYAEEALVVGMGGSGVAGDVAAVFAEAHGRRVAVHKSYGLPGWAEASRPLVIGVSHSGNTEETLSAVEATITEGLPVGTMSTGGALAEIAREHGIPHVEIPDGPQPRAAMGYLSGAVLRVLESSGVVGATATGLLEAAQVVEDLLGGEAQKQAENLAEALDGRITIVYGTPGVTSTAAGRWKTQINENSKAPAYWSAFPELDHNELVGWTAHPDLGADSVGIVLLTDSGDDPRVGRRVRLTRELMEGVEVAGEVASRGEGVLARLFSLVIVGDLVSVALAERSGVDPMPVEVIEKLKKRLAE
ncbi:MAG TPA: bifunctional phosphoglucose/phosphomannose isomerase [Acidimicrobiia bacterium]|nr:bifunctional phosphoglucose/phosphomannose isomerase [Acidimicrobiia bacterium]